MPRIIVNLGTDPGTDSHGTTGGPGTLSYALAQLNASDPALGPYTIDLQTDVALSGPLSPIFGSVTIEGNGHTIDAGGSTRIFFVGTDQAAQSNVNTLVGMRQQVAIRDVTLKGGLAQGGSSGTGGGGLGAGGALFVNQTADVRLTNVSFVDDRAVGGSSGVANLGKGGGGLGGNGGDGGGGLFGNGGYGGGGLFGNGGGGDSSGSLFNRNIYNDPANPLAGGGGYSGDGGKRGEAGENGKLAVFGFTGSGGSGGAPGGTLGGGGGGGAKGSPAPGGGGGGFNGKAGTVDPVNGGGVGTGGFGGGGGVSYNGASGGFGGGGAVASDSATGSGGGFGGGGAGGRTYGGNGGFGGGGGSGSGTLYGSGGGGGGFGAGGGSGNASEYGYKNLLYGPGGFGTTNGTAAQGALGAGAGMGGAVFVVQGGTLAIDGNGTLTGTATGGNGNGGGTASAFGDGIFYQGIPNGPASSLTFGAGTVTVGSGIADYIGSGGTNPSTSFGGSRGTIAADQGGSLALVKSGGGTLTLAARNTYSGGTTIGGRSDTLDSTVQLNAAGAAGTGAITFAPLSGNVTGRLVVAASAQPVGTTFANTIAGFKASSQITLVRLSNASVAGYSNGTLTVTGTLAGNTVTEAFRFSSPPPAGFVTRSDGAGGTVIAVCFTTGTRIRTARGEVAVEELAAGDLAVTACGALRPITWIGHRHLAGAGRALPHDQQPIRIRAGAFGSGLPGRDLRLSPGHPVLVGADAEGAGGHLVPIMCLINGTSITREPVSCVTYWHVELDSHDILLAEGLAAESYLDWGDRPFFTEASDHALHNPDFVVPGLAARCRPVAIDGSVVEAERARLSGVFAAALVAACAWDDTGFPMP